MLISLFSIGFNFYYGYVGIFPIDSFLIFDSGYYVLNGFYPFKDYWTVTGPLLDYFQAFLFLIFGTNWFSYVLHASIMNLLLAIFSYFIFVQLGLKKIYSFIYSCGISLLAYPIIGTPFMDHHSAILSLIAIFIFIISLKTKSNFSWFFIPIILGLAFLSKQTPAAFMGIIIAFISTIYFVYNFDRQKILYFLLQGMEM